jgi:hypothetical protein
VTLAGPDRSLALLERTRGAVLNVLIAEGTGIAVSGALLRWRGSLPAPVVGESTRAGLLGGLVAAALVSYVTRRTLAGRPALRDPETRERSFFRGHVLSAAIGGLAVPLGLAFGWLVRPTLEAVGPFFLVALTLGALAWPRRHELDDLEWPGDAGEPGPAAPQARPGADE